MARPDEPIEPVRYTKMVLNSNPIDHLRSELVKAYAYIDELEAQLAAPAPSPTAEPLEGSVTTAEPI